MNEKSIEIVQWVKFNKPGLKEEVIALSKQCETLMDYVRSLRTKYGLDLSDCKIIADKFFKKEV